jgi:adenylate cyclase
MSFGVNGQLVPLGGGDPIPLIREELIIGRRESCDIRLPFPNVSHQHARLTFLDGYWYIQDLNSTNGVKVNGAREQKKRLLPDDEITIAKRKYTVKYVLPVGQRGALDEDLAAEDVMGQSLLEKAGLERPKTRRDEFPRRKSKEERKDLEAAEFLLDEEDED